MDMMTYAQPQAHSESHSQLHSQTHSQTHFQTHSPHDSLQSFNYHNISVDKAHSLGSGSYGAVYKATGDQLPCAAKVMHNILSSQEDPGSLVSLQQFQTECQLLSLVRHPNIVQYLSTSFDEESGQPVLLMELCEESLTKFLELSPGPLPYHMELSISHDIALALIHLHSNGLIHRDLSSNNVLMDGGRAKVTDFGMSKLQGAPVQTKTLCPGSVHYMPPEALDEPPSYTEKIDVFSFGVLLVQIMTRKFPDPSPRFRVEPDHRYPTGIRVPIREVERRQSHLKLIDDFHPLKALALRCLGDNEQNRPTAQELGVRIEQLKASQILPVSLRKSPRPERRTWTRSVEDQEPVEFQQMLHQERLEEQLEKLRLQLAGQRVISNALSKELEKANREVMEERKKLKFSEKEKAREKAIMEKDQKREKEMVEKEEQWKKDVSEKDKKMAKLKQELEDSQEFVKVFQHSLSEKDQKVKELERKVSDLQRSLQQKEEMISSLQKKIVANEERIEELERQATNGMLQTLTVAPKRDITKLRWEEVEKMPEPMSAGTAVTIGDNVFVNPASSKTVYCYSRVRTWSLLPRCRYESFSLAVVNNTLTTVGGLGDEYTNKLLSYTELGGWTETLPPMPTSRRQPVTVSTEQYLIVAGGFNGLKPLETVEALSIPNNTWSTVCSLAHPLYGGSATLCDNQIYIVPEVVGTIARQDVVLSCFFDNLFKPAKKPRFGNKPAGPWQRLKNNLPAALSTITTLDGHIIALGGKDMQAKNSTHTSATVWELVQSSWKNVSSMNIGRWSSMAAVLPGGRLMVMGGKSNWENMDSVEIATL